MWWWPGAGVVITGVAVPAAVKIGAGVTACSCRYHKIGLVKHGRSDSAKSTHIRGTHNAQMEVGVI